MRLCMTLLVRDEESILRENIDYHLSRGVDFIVATDNRSEDSTAAILLEYERQGVLRYIYEPADDYSQDRWVTRMARLAAEEHRADWVMHVDADEFWWPVNDANLKTPLTRVPGQVDGIMVHRTNFRPLQEEDAGKPFYQRMQIRERYSLNAHGRPFPGKIAHRADRQVSVHQGNHGFDANGQPSTTIESEHYLIFHFPFRDFAQFQNKIRKGGAAYARNTRLARHLGDTWRKLYEKETVGELQDWFDEQTLDQAQLEKGLANGRLLQDARLADYLTELRDSDPMRSGRGAHESIIF